MKNLIRKFESLNGAKFIGIDGYTNRHGEISNQVINTNISVENAKKADLETLKSFNVATLEVSNVELAKVALNELIESAEKNLSNDRTAQSKGQTDAFISLGKGLRLNKENFQVQVFGFAQSKTVLQEGTYPTVNKQEKTVIKDAIKKTAKLKMNKFRSFYIGNADTLKVTGSTIQIL